MVSVVKRNGSREDFNPEKIKDSIRSAGGRTDMLPGKVDELAEGVAGEIAEVAEKRGEIRSDEIRAMVLDRLREARPDIANEFRTWPKTEKPESGEEFK